MSARGYNTTEEFDCGITAGQKMMSAMSGSLLTSCFITPLDVVRVRVQSQPVLKSSTIVAANIPSALQRPFKSTFDGLSKIAKYEGLPTLWRGLSPLLAMTVPANIIYFTGYDWLKSKDGPIQKLIPEPYVAFTAGSSARILAASSVSPLEMFKIRMQASRGPGRDHFSKTLTGMKRLVATRGYSSLYRGLALTLWRDVPFSGLYWTGYETLRGILTRRRDEKMQLEGTQISAVDEHSDAFVDAFIAGATSGTVAAVLTTPFDVGKTRRQVFRDAKPLISETGRRILAPEEKFMLQFLWHIFKTEGLAGLFKGVTPRTLKIAPSCATMIACYEVGKILFQKANVRAAEEVRMQQTERDGEKTMI